MRSFVCFSLAWSATACAQEATGIISATPGFEAVIDSGPTQLSSAFIDGRIADLQDEAAATGCNATVWAGTWVRNRSPRLQGSTELGLPIEATSIVAGQVGGIPFSASLASGGRVQGETQVGHPIEGYFTRLNSRRSIFYAVETSCPSSGLPTVGPLTPVLEADVPTPTTYAFQMESAGELSVTVVGTGGTDPVLRLLDDDGHVLFTLDGQVGADTEEQLTMSVAADEIVRFMVDSFGSFGTVDVEVELDGT